MLCVCVFRFVCSLWIVYVDMQRVCSDCAGRELGLWQAGVYFAWFAMDRVYVDVLRVCRVQRLCWEGESVASGGLAASLP